MPRLLWLCLDRFRPPLSTFLLLGRSHRVSVMGFSPQTTLSHLWQRGAAPLFDKIDSHFQPGHCVNILTSAVLSSCAGGHWLYLGWRRPVAPILTLSCPNNGIWQVPSTFKSRWSCWSALTQASYWLSLASPQWLWPSGRRQHATSELQISCIAEKKVLQLVYLRACFISRWLKVLMFHVPK